MRGECTKEIWDRESGNGERAGEGHGNDLVSGITRMMCRGLALERGGKQRDRTQGGARGGSGTKEGRSRLDRTALWRNQSWRVPGTGGSAWWEERRKMRREAEGRHEQGRRRCPGSRARRPGADGLRCRATGSGGSGGGQRAGIGVLDGRRSLKRWEIMTKDLPEVYVTCTVTCTWQGRAQYAAGSGRSGAGSGRGAGAKCGSKGAGGNAQGRPRGVSEVRRARAGAAAVVGPGGGKRTVKRAAG
ncbi:hypothetical protein B0H13DRAFT_1891100 [Mycena leptocephala]|nr:hypothetical protein B0H13DRAFT_1891100 [Mycena leptocephala]